MPDFGSFIKKKRELAQDTQDRVHVYCRLRPSNAVDAACNDEFNDESETNASAPLNPIEDYDQKSVCVRDFDGKRKQFEFDRFLDAKATQHEMFTEAAIPVIDAVIEGHNGTIFAYGQTGSGKTHTMLGPSSEAAGALPSAQAEGIIPRSLRRLFKAVADQEVEFEFKITVSYIQIYCEILSDLLQPSNADSLVIREHSGRSNEVYVSGASRFTVATPEDCLRHIQAGSLNRTTAFTQMNATSSRSHAVFILSMEKRTIVKDLPANADADAADKPEEKRTMVRSQLFLVDLAGSERVAHTGVMVGSDRFRELRAINLSLSALGNCIHALSSAAKKNDSTGNGNGNGKGAGSGAAFVPYRDSKLTRLLQNSLGGNSRTSLIITIGPSPKHARETLSTLQFGTRAMAVQVTSVVNVEVDYKALYQKLLAEADKRDDRIHELELSEREHQMARAAAEKAKERADAKAEKLALELEVQKASTEKLEAAMKNNFVEEDEAQAEEDSVFLTGSGIESPTSTRRGVDARLALEMEQKMREEAEAMAANFEKQLEKIRKQSQRRVDNEAKKAAQAVADWHALELELQQTKEEMLETLQRHGEMQAELIAVEQDSTERIADLTLKVQDLEAELEEANDGANGVGGELPDEQVEAIRERVEKRVLENYVSQEKVVEMKELYDNVVNKLEGRIDKLEVDVTKVTSPATKGRSGGHGASSARSTASTSRRSSSTSSSRYSRGQKNTASTRNANSSRNASSTRNKSKSSSHVSVIRSRAQAASAVKRSSYSLSTTRGSSGKSTSRRGGATAASAKSRAKEYAEKQRAQQMMADAARIRNRRAARQRKHMGGSSLLSQSGLAAVREGGRSSFSSRKAGVGTLGSSRSRSNPGRRY